MEQITPDKSTAFLMSPDGKTIYYMWSDYVRSPLVTSLYAVDADGTHSRMLRENVYPVGFAADGALLVIQLSQEKTYQAVKLGSTAQQDRVIMEDLAPGADTRKCENIAEGCGYASLAPNGRWLLFGPRQTEGSVFWADDLSSGRHYRLFQEVFAYQVKVLGWNCLPV